MFFEVLKAINDPNQQANIDQLAQVTTSVQKLASSQGVNPHQMETMMTALGSALHPILHKKQSQLGSEKLASMVGKTDDASVLTSIISLPLQQQLAQTVAQTTGMQASIAQTLLPQLLPMVMRLFNMGSPTPGSIGETNSLLSTFLDDSCAVNTDLGNVMKFADRFLNTSN